MTEVLSYMTSPLSDEVTCLAVVVAEDDGQFGVVVRLSGLSCEELAGRLAGDSIAEMFKLLDATLGPNDGAVH